MNSFVTAAAAASIGALAVAPLVTPLPSVSAAHQTADVQLAADSTPIGAIPRSLHPQSADLLRADLSVDRGPRDERPARAAEAPVAFVGGLQSGSLLRAVGGGASR